MKLSVGSVLAATLALTYPVQASNTILKGRDAGWSRTGSSTKAFTHIYRQSPQTRQTCLRKRLSPSFSGSVKKQFRPLPLLALSILVLGGH